MTLLGKQKGKPFGESAGHIIWSQCTDMDITMGGKQNKKYVAQPVLKLHTNIPLVYTENTDIANGEANGMLCYLVKIHLDKEATEEDFQLMNIDGI
jgi:hypothetical protein